MLKLQSAVGDALTSDTDAVSVFVFENEKRLHSILARADKQLNRQLTKLAEWNEVKGKLGEVTIVHTLGLLKPKRLVLVGVGKRSELDTEKFRRAIGWAVKAFNRIGIKRAVFAIEPSMTQTMNISNADIARALTEGALLANYRYTRKSNNDGTSGMEILELLTSNRNIKSELDKGIRLGTVMATATNFAKDLVNAPPTELTPSALAEVAEIVAKRNNLTCEVYDEHWIEQKGMGALRAVSLGSDQPPRFIVLRYFGRKEAKTVGLVGKGITFDSGGLCIKTAEGMVEMKGDMAGAAAVISAMDAIGQLQPKVNVLAFIPATENMPSGRAYKPGDILRTYSGKTVEVVNTDAEGRLILADALSYAVSQGASLVLDAATLTGSAIIALGPVCAAAFGNDDKLMKKIVEASRQTGELIWAMPLLPDYRSLIDSDLADIKNTGGKAGGAITAAYFLSEFVGNKSWLHLDIAPTFWTEKDDHYLTKGATGFAVRTFVQFALNLSSQ